jgi:bifunctional UDP-N-acetylglucosamine pyrophosphorylase/glucosamine-1-phosphate N-acetyltransferase
MKRVKMYFDDMEACPCKEVFEKIEYPWQALKKKDEIIDFSQNKIKGEIAGTAEITGNVVIGKGTKVGSNVMIEGPCIIGENCLIRPGAMIRPKSIIGNNVVVGHGVELKNSIIFNEAKISTNSFVGDSILGKGARVASGVIIGNRRFDQKEVKIRIAGKFYPTGMEKFGCILGEYARIGANCSTTPGTLIGKHTWTYANMMIRGVIQPKKLLKLRQKIEIANKKETVLAMKDKEGEV